MTSAGVNCEAARLDAAIAVGRAIAETFAAAGAAVAVTDRDAATAEQAAAAITQAGGKATAAACDVTKEADLVAAVDQAVQAFGSLTILVNNAGGGGPKPFDMPMADMRLAFELNLFSVFRLCQLAVPHMEAAGGGAILNITSMAGDNKNQPMASYGASKAAENHLTRNIAFDLGPMNIRVNGIAPGATRTMPCRPCSPSTLRQPCSSARRSSVSASPRISPTRRSSSVHRQRPGSAGKS
jgi:7-alpha-hydroxysteroid dehydrogenase